MKLISLFLVLFLSFCKEKGKILEKEDETANQTNVSLTFDEAMSKLNHLSVSYNPVKDDSPEYFDYNLPMNLHKDSKIDTHEYSNQNDSCDHVVGNWIKIDTNKVKASVVSTIPNHIVDEKTNTVIGWDCTKKINYELEIQFDITKKGKCYTVITTINNEVTDQSWINSLDSKCSDLLEKSRNLELEKSEKK
jgi:hypothetical protein